MHIHVCMCVCFCVRLFRCMWCVVCIVWCVCVYCQGLHITMCHCIRCVEHVETTGVVMI